MEDAASGVLTDYASTLALSLRPTTWKGGTVCVRYMLFCNQNACNWFSGKRSEQNVGGKNGTNTDEVFDEEESKKKGSAAGS